MAKKVASYSCSSCNYHTPKWIGCCPGCQEWNTIVEKQYSSIKQALLQEQAQLVCLNNIDIAPHKRMLSGIDEWDRVMGGGIVPGSLLVLTGDPGIGKSTLLLQIANALAQSYTVLYFSTEESLRQLAGRAQRLQCNTNSLLFSDCSDLEVIIKTAQTQKPTLIIIDSIQNCSNSDTQNLPGSIGQLRESAFKLMQLAKEHTIAVLISGHITKDGTIAGPKIVEHVVDAVFYLQGEDQWQTRILRSTKNRFGAINEVGFFSMHGNGLSQITNINEHLIKELTYSPGSALISVLEGSRPLLVELQALTIASKMTLPQRVISGVDHKQVILIAAILEKYLHIKLSAHDIFFKISGATTTIKNNISDLGIAIALLSSYFQQPLPHKSIALGEISLTGQIKPINNISILTKDLENFGITHILLSKNQTFEHTHCTTLPFSNVYELVSLFS